MVEIALAELQQKLAAFFLFVLPFALVAFALFRGVAAIGGAFRGEKARAAEARERRREKAAARRDRAIQRQTERLRRTYMRRAARMELEGATPDSVAETALNIFPKPVPGRRRDTAAVRLSPQVKPGGLVAGYMGGAPELPFEITYPVDQRGEEMGFLAQIDCAALPDLLWSGAGPRTGYLRFFFPQKWGGWKPWPYVVHSRERGRLRSGPPLEASEWYAPPPSLERRGGSARPATPHWPLVVEALLGDEDPVGEFRLGGHPHHPDPRDIEAFDLREPEYRPWSRDGLANVVRVAGEQLRFSLNAMDGPYSGGKPDTPLRARYRQILTLTVEALARLHQEIVSGAIDPATGFERFEAIEIPQILWTEPAPGEKPVQMFGPVYSLAAPPARAALSPYALRDALFDLDRFAFVEQPGRLPGPVRKRLQSEFAFFAAYERFGMGHRPSGVYQGAPAYDDRYEVLLELPSSQLAGWRFGDLDSICFVISRADLQAGDFSRVMLDVSNG